MACGFRYYLFHSARCGIHACLFYVSVVCYLFISVLFHCMATSQVVHLFSCGWTLVVSSLRLCSLELLKMFSNKTCENMASFFSSETIHFKYLEGKLLGLGGGTVLVLWATARFSQSGCIIFYYYQQCMSSICSKTFGIFSLLNFSHWE